jgi:hypothetical protein
VVGLAARSGLPLVPQFVEFISVLLGIRVGRRVQQALERLGDHVVVDRLLLQDQGTDTSGERLEDLFVWR